MCLIQIEIVDVIIKIKTYKQYTMRITEIEKD